MTRHRFHPLNPPSQRSEIKDETTLVPPRENEESALEGRRSCLPPPLYLRSPDNREPITHNSRRSALVRGDDEDHRSDDNAKDPEKGVDAALEGSSVEIGFGRHG